MPFNGEARIDLFPPGVEKIGLAGNAQNTKIEKKNTNNRTRQFTAPTRLGLETERLPVNGEGLLKQA